MKVCFAAFMVGAIWVGSNSFAEEKPVPVNGKTLEQWAAQLGAEKFADREEASKALAAAGDRALAVLKTACNSEEPEVRSRARATLRQVVEAQAETLVDAALSSDTAAAETARKKLIELGAGAGSALKARLGVEKERAQRLAIMTLLARCGAGRTGYRISLELNPDGSGRLGLSSDRTLLVECVRGTEQLTAQPAAQFEAEEMVRNPYSEATLAKYIGPGMKYEKGGVEAVDGRIMASGEVSFSSFDALQTFALNFDKVGYHLLSGIALVEKDGVQELKFKKAAESDNARTQRYLMQFHPLSWEFVLNIKGGALKSHNATQVRDGKAVWRFDCAQMIGGEAVIEASFEGKK